MKQDVIREGPSKQTSDIVAETNETEPAEETPKQRRAKKAAKARADKLTPARRKAIAKKAAEARRQK